MSTAIKILFGIKKPNQPLTMASKDDHSDLPEPDFMAQAKSVTDKIPQEKLDEKGQTREEAQQEMARALKIVWLNTQGGTHPIHNVSGNTTPSGGDPGLEDPDPPPKDEFWRRCRGLGALSKRFQNALAEAKNYLSVRQYDDPRDDDDENAGPPVPLVSMEHAEVLVRDVEDAFNHLAEKRQYCESVLTEEELDRRPNYMAPKIAELNAIRHLYGLRLKHEADLNARDTTTGGGGDGGGGIHPDDPANDQLSQLARTMNTVMGVSFNLSEHIDEKFSGSIIKFPSFMEQIELGIEEMERLNKSKAQMLVEIKGCCSGAALKQIQHIRNTNENLEVAISLLEELFGDKSVFTTYVIKKLFKVKQMEDKRSSLLDGLSTVRYTWDQIQKLQMDPQEFALRVFIAVVVPKLSPVALKKWEDFLVKNKDPTSPTGSKPLTFDNFIGCIKLALSNCQTSSANFQPNDEKKDNRRDRAQGGNRQQDNLPLNFQTKVGEAPCYICKTKKPDHYPAKCPNVRKLDRDQLNAIVKNDKLCSQCFTKGHSASSKSCFFTDKKCERKDEDGSVCGKRHHPKLCKFKSSGQRSFKTSNAGGNAGGNAGRNAGGNRRQRKEEENDKKDLEESEVKNPDDENKQNEPKATGTKNKTGGKYGGNPGWG